MTDRRIDLAVAALLFAGAAWLRLARVDLVVLNADTIGPYFRAWTILDGQGLLPASHAPESGPGLYWISALFVAGADGLRAAFERRYLFAAAVAPALYLAVRTRGSRSGALFAGGAAALSAGLVQTLDSGYQGYLAPELATIAVVGLVLSGAGERARPLGWTLPAVPLAMMCHPFALALVLPVGVAVGIAWRRDPGGRSALVGGALAAAALGGVRLHQLATAPAGLLAETASGNSSGAAPARVVADAVFAIPSQDGGLAAVLFAAPVLVAVLGRRTVPGRLAGMYLLGVLALWCAGAAIGYLQPYHHRILLPLALASMGCAIPPTAELLSVRGAKYVDAVVVLLVVAAGARAWSSEPPPAPDLSVHADLADAIAADAGDDGRWVEFATLGPRSWGSPAALVLQGLLAGGEAEPYTRPGPLYLVVAGPRAAMTALASVDGARRIAGRELRGGDRAAVVRLEGPTRAQAWSRGVCAAAGEPLRVERRAADWIAFLRPGYTDAFTTRWFDPCVIGGPGG